MACSCVECWRKRRKERSRRIEHRVISQLTCKATPEWTVSRKPVLASFPFVPCISLRAHPLKPPPSSLLLLHARHPLFLPFHCSPSRYGKQRGIVKMKLTEAILSRIKRNTNLPMSALLTGETVQVIDIRPGLHDHLERRYLLVASRAVSRVPEQPEVVPLAEDKVRLGEQSRTDLS